MKVKGILFQVRIPDGYADYCSSYLPTSSEMNSLPVVIPCDTNSADGRSIPEFAMLSSSIQQEFQESIRFALKQYKSDFKEEYSKKEFEILTERLRNTLVHPKEFVFKGGCRLGNYVLKKKSLDRFNPNVLSFVGDCDAFVVKPNLLSKMKHSGLKATTIEVKTVRGVLPLMEIIPEFGSGSYIDTSFSGKFIKNASHAEMSFVLNPIERTIPCEKEFYPLEFIELSS